MIDRIRLLWALFLLTGSSVPAHAQRLGGGGAAPDISVVRIFAALLLCLAAAFAVALLIRSRKGALPSLRMEWLRGGMASSRRIKIVETRRASAHADVCLVQCDGEEYLVLCGPSAQTVLRWSKGTVRDDDGTKGVD